MVAEVRLPPELERVEQQDFSVLLGGPLYQLFRRAHMSGESLEMLRQRMIFLALLAWLPLLLLSALGGQLLHGTALVPFLRDIQVHIRFLVAVPLLTVAELVVHKRMRLVVRQFLERRLIPQNARVRFDLAVVSAMRLRNSILAELMLIAFVYGVGVLIIWRQYVPLDKPTWFTMPAIAGLRLSLAGIWYGYVSLPLFQFLLVRWYFRLFVWMRFLWQVSRIELNLVPTHPDRVGGLGFLANISYAFAPLAAAHGVVLAGMIANAIFHLGDKLTAYKAHIAVVVVFIQCIVFAPLLVFAGRLANAKRSGQREYGALAARYVGEFDAKWLRGGAPSDEPLVGSADIQSLADLGNSFEIVQGMRMAPVTKGAILQLAIATLLPIVPLLLTMMPLEELLRKLLGLMF